MLEKLSLNIAKYAPMRSTELCVTRNCLNLINFPSVSVCIFRWLAYNFEFDTNRKLL